MLRIEGADDAVSEQLMRLVEPVPAEAPRAQHNPDRLPLRDTLPLTRDRPLVHDLEAIRGERVVAPLRVEHDDIRAVLQELEGERRLTPTRRADHADVLTG